MSEIKCTDRAALPGAGICVAAARRPAMVLDCSSKAPLRCRQRRLCLRARSAPFPQQERLERAAGDPRWHLGSAWLRVGSYARRMLRSNVPVPVKTCRSCWLLSTSCPVHTPEPTEPAARLPRCRWASGQGVTHGTQS